MERILIRNALLVTLDDTQPDSLTGDLLICDNLIESISPEAGNLDQMKVDRIIDGSNYLVMPGLVNTHGHAAMTLFRGFADDLPLREWLEEMIWPIEEFLTEEDVYWGTMLAAVEMIRGGTTTFTDMYFFMEQTARAAAESGLRAVLSRGMVGFGDSAEAGLLEARQLIDRWQGEADGRINIYLGPHAPYTCPPEYLKKVIKLAEEQNRPLQIHLSETKGEVDESYNKYGKSPVELVNEVGLFEHPVTAAHCVHTSDKDLEIMAEKNVTVAHNPGSNLKLGSGVAPVAKMLEKGITVGIGTDGAASNNNLDMFEELRLTSLLQKGVNMDPTLVNAKKVLSMATFDGAQALHLESVGRLKEGYRADLIALNLNRAHLLPLHNPLAHLAYAASATDVELVIIDGKILLEKNELKTIDEERVYHEASKCAARLTGNYHDSRRA